MECVLSFEELQVIGVRGDWRWNKKVGNWDAWFAFIKRILLGK